MTLLGPLSFVAFWIVLAVLIYWTGERIAAKRKENR